MTAVVTVPSATEPRRVKCPRPLALARDPLGCLRAAVDARVGRRVRDLRIESVGGAVVLSGHTDSYHTKQLAQHAVLAAGRAVLANRIEVRPPVTVTPYWPVAALRFTGRPSPAERN